MALPQIDLLKVFRDQEQVKKASLVAIYGTDFHTNADYASAIQVMGWQPELDSGDWVLDIKSNLPQSTGYAWKLVCPPLQQLWTPSKSEKMAQTLLESFLEMPDPQLGNPGLVLYLGAVHQLYFPDSDEGVGMDAAFALPPLEKTQAVIRAHANWMSWKQRETQL